MAGENISTREEETGASAGLKKARLRLQKNLTGTNDFKTPQTRRSVNYPENVSEKHQNDAARLLKKEKNEAVKTSQSDQRGSGESAIGRPLPVIPQSTGDSMHNKTNEEVPADKERETQATLEKEKADSAKNIEAGGKKTAVRTNLTKEASKLQNKIRGHKARIGMLGGVLAIALIKDFLDIMGEMLSVGTWGFIDWIIDISLSIAFFLLRIEKQGTDQLVGWGFVLVEMIPIADVMPSWTLRVAKAMNKTYQEIKNDGESLRKIDKILNKAGQPRRT